MTEMDLWQLLFRGLLSPNPGFRSWLSSSRPQRWSSPHQPWNSKSAILDLESGEARGKSMERGHGGTGANTQKIKLSEAYYKYWTRTFSCSRAELAEAVEAVGHNASAVKEYLERQVRDEDRS
jgi:hypothetical protein